MRKVMPGGTTNSRMKTGRRFPPERGFTDRETGRLDPERLDTFVGTGGHFQPERVASLTGTRTPAHFGRDSR